MKMTLDRWGACGLVAGLAMLCGCKDNTPEPTRIEAPRPAATPSATPTAEVELKTEVDRISYAIGTDIARNITNRQVEVNPEALAAGFRTILRGTKPLLTDEQVKEAMTTLQTRMQAKNSERMQQQQSVQKEAGEKNKKEGEAFLVENKKKEGVQATESGLQYKIMTTGTGPKPSSGDTVVVHYRGTLLNGTEFDSSYRRGEPTEFPVTGVIKGWTEALLMMPVGSKWQLYIPSELAYGERGAGGNIGPNAVLQFDVELVGIKGKAEPKGETKPEAAKPDANATPAPKPDAKTEDKPK